MGIEGISTGLAGTIGASADGASARANSDVETLALRATSGTPVEQGEALRSLDLATGDRGATDQMVTVEGRAQTQLYGSLQSEPGAPGWNPLRDAGEAIFRDLEQARQDFNQRLTSLPSDAANALADSMRGPNARPLTSGEERLVREAFGNSIDLSNVRIVDGAGRNPDAAFALNGLGRPAITEGNTVYINSARNPDGAPRYYSADLSRTVGGRETLLHEFTHVRQFQQMGFAAFGARYFGRELPAAGFDADKMYDYRSRDTTFQTETLEGQAQIVGDYAAARARHQPAPDLEARLRGTGIYGL